MAPKPIPMPSAAVVDPTQLATVDWFSFWKSQADAVGGLVNASTRTTGSPLYSAQFGLNLLPATDSIIYLPNSPWLLRADDKYLYCGSLGVTPVLLYQVDPNKAAINKTINVGVTVANEIRGIRVLGAFVYFVDRAAGKVYKVDRATFTLVGTLTGLFTGGGGQGPFCITADLTSLYLGVTITGGSLLLKLDPNLFPTGGGTASYTTALFQGGTNTLNLGGNDTHNLEWDGGASVWVTNISSDNVIYRVAKDTMTLTTAFGANGGQWGVFSTGERMFYTELGGGVDNINWRPLGAISHGFTGALPVGAGAADVQVIDDEIWMAFSTQTNVGGFWVGQGANPNAPNTLGAVAVYDALTGAQKRVMDNGGGHCASICPFGPDVWSTDATGQFLRRWRRRSSSLSTFG